jgi:hypothetical protein
MNRKGKGEMRHGEPGRRFRDPGFSSSVVVNLWYYNIY